MAWLFEAGDLKPVLLDGGYKSYRNHILDQLAIKRKTLVLGGMTGSGKTEILKILGQRGEQIVDLEMIASHRGSAFGALGQGNQPTTEHFANLLFEWWRDLDFTTTIWLEDESRNIGSVFLPELFWNNMQSSPVVAIISSIETRLPRLVRDYSLFPAEDLIESVRRISKRLGGDRTTDAVKAIETGDFARAAEITLTYYDKAYLFSLHRRDKELIHTLQSSSGDAEQNATMVIEYAMDKGLL
jgi:tRNA 2-selenouridine synthase